jgi:outer membrane protein
MFKRIYTSSSHRFIFSVLCIVLMCFEFKSYAQALSGDSIVLISLAQAIELGVKNSYKLKSANLEVEQGHEDIRQSKTDRLPDINLGVNGYLINDPILFNEEVFQDPERIDYTPYQLNGSLMASEVIYAGRKIKNSINQKVLEKKIAEFSAVKTSADVKMTIINEYLNCIPC